MSTVFVTLANKIIKHQEDVIGPLAWSEASKVEGLKVSDHTVSIEGDGKQALEKLVNQYKGLFGRASVEVCKDAVKTLISDIDPKDLPEVLLH